MTIRGTAGETFAASARFPARVRAVSHSSRSLGRRFWVLAAARTVSVAGNGFGRVALAFGVLSLPGAGAGTVSLVLACQALPQLALVLLGGAIADRVSRSRLIVTAEVAALAAWAGLAIVIVERVTVTAVVCVLALLAGAATSMFTPAMSGLIPALVDHGQLQRANGLLRMGQNGALLLGLGLSGAVVAALGPAWALGINSASFGVSAALIATIRVPNPSRAASTLIADLREGARDFFSRQWLWVVVAQFSVVVAAVNATVGVLGPLLMLRRYGGATAWSLIIGAQAAGTVGGAGLAGRIRVRRPILVAVLVTFAFALPMLLLGLQAPVWWCASAMLLSGVANDVFGVLWATTMQQRIPRHLLSRVSAYDLFGSLALAPLGLLVAGPLAVAIGTTTALLGCAVLTVVVTIAALISPQVRTLKAEDAARGLMQASA